MPTPLMVGCAIGLATHVRLLIESVAQNDREAFVTKVVDGRTAMHFACGNDACVSLLEPYAAALAVVPNGMPTFLKAKLASKEDAFSGLGSVWYCLCKAMRQVSAQCDSVDALFRRAATAWWKRCASSSTAHPWSSRSTGRRARSAHCY